MSVMKVKKLLEPQQPPSLQIKHCMSPFPSLLCHLVFSVSPLAFDFLFFFVRQPGFAKSSPYPRPIALIPPPYFISQQKTHRASGSRGGAELPFNAELNAMGAKERSLAQRAAS